MKYLGLDSSILTAKGAFHTAKEISQQPELWEKVWKAVKGEKSQLSQFLTNALSKSKRIILTGAGTSAFIGISLVGLYRRSTKIVTEAISTTALVSHPKDYLQSGIPLLMISFARSGNSPESVATVALVDELCGSSCFHLIITCNAQGELARYGARMNKHAYVFNLPAEANDQSLAMTSSYTSMLLAGLLIAQLPDLDANKKMVSAIAQYARKAIEYYYEGFQLIAHRDFKRAVFLGSGPLQGTATESHLKLQELTDGKIICKDDSFLGFRHGPKVVIDETTLVVYIFSNQNYVLKYERDLVQSMRKGNTPLLEIGIMESPLTDISLDYRFPFSENGIKVSEEFLAICSVVPGQLIAFFKSLNLGLQPDAPSATGAISRVVQGVQIYGLKD